MSMQTTDDVHRHYVVMDSPNEGENGTLCCQADGCDGLVFDSLEACQEHSEDWHQGPYDCVECDAVFASQPARSRHSKATGHRRWICTQEGCEMKGVEFETHCDYLTHMLSSPQHVNPCQDDRDVANAARERMEDESTETLSTCPSDIEQTCMEPCCSKYLQTLTTSNYEVHTQGHGHFCATRAGEKLRGMALDSDTMEEKCQEFRQLCCGEPGCTAYGRKFTTSTSFWHHLSTPQHNNTTTTAKKTDNGVANTNHKNHEVHHDVQEALELDRDRRTCKMEGCTKYLYTFAKRGTYKAHLRSSAHKRVTIADALSIDIFQANESSTAAMNYNWGAIAPVTPSTSGSRGPFKFVSPRLFGAPQSPMQSPLAWRDENITMKRENEYLKNEVIQLKDEIYRGKLDKADLEKDVLQLRSAMEEMRVKHEERMDLMLSMLAMPN